MYIYKQDIIPKLVWTSIICTEVMQITMKASTSTENVQVTDYNIFFNRNIYMVVTTDVHIRHKTGNIYLVVTPEVKPLLS
jgi:hypothetical protein